MRRRIACVLLALCLLASLCPGAAAADSGVRIERVADPGVQLTDAQQPSRTGEDRETFSPETPVRVSIVLEEKGLLEQGLSISAAAAADVSAISARQDELTGRISAVIGEPLEVQWKLTLAANLISATVEYGQIETIAAMPGVKTVLIEPLFTVPETEIVQPMQHSALGMTGTAAAWAAGFSGLGSRIAILDTGVNDKHQSFDENAWRYAVEECGKDDVSLLDQTELEKILPSLHLHEQNPEATAEEIYRSAKIPFAYNYADKNFLTDHSDGVNEHGSHVAGIAGANRYVPDGNGGYASALDQELVTGQAPEAQILNMRVFNSSGGASATDYLAAIEDAVRLGCDVVNLSLGTVSPGYVKYYEEYYDQIWTNLQDTDLVLSVSMGNAYGWADFADAGGVNYIDSPNFYTGGSPGSRAESLTIASVNNTTSIFNHFTLGGQAYSYFEHLPEGAPNRPFLTLDGEYDYLFFAACAGMPEDFEGMDLTGKVVFLQQGADNMPEGIPFSSIHERLQSMGAAAYVMCNITSRNFAMDLTQSKAEIPGISISQNAAESVRSASEELSEGVYAGKLSVSRKVEPVATDDAGQMSRFSSWGVPGDLSLKPELTAPGGYVYSVNGNTTDGYEAMSGTSMAAPQVAGMTAILAQYIRENHLTERTGLTQRQLIHSLLMSTAQPLTEAASGLPYSMLKQGAGMADVSAAMLSGATVTTSGQTDGKAKVELGDDPSRSGVYTAKFTLHNLTDEALSYFLSAQTLTQAHFSGETNGQTVEYLSGQTAELEAGLTVLVDGVPAELPQEVLTMDFDGDGDVDIADGQAIVDYVSGERTALSNADRADLDGDGEITSVDAHLFLKKLNGQSITVPAGETVEVEATVALTAAQKEELDRLYTGGAYIEIYLRLAAQASLSGAITSDLGLPVFAYYGSWTDAAMFDVSTRTQRSNLNAASGDHRAPYLFDWNYVMMTRKGNYDEYAGNPYVYDDDYMPERYAISSEDGTSIDGFSYGLIRNALDTRILIQNTDTGELYRKYDTGSCDGWYLNTSSGVWTYENDEWYFQPYRMTDAAGNPLPEGTRVSVIFQAAPEYYRQNDGTINWDALGEGSRLSLTLTVDNTAPEAVSISRELLDGETIHVSVRDNRYVACVAIMNKDGSRVYERRAVNQTEIGTVSTLDFDYSNLPGNTFLLAVCDYAMNETYYKVTIEGRPARELTQKFRGYGSVLGWVAFDENVNQDEVRLTERTDNYSTVCYADGRALAINGKGLFIYPEDDNFDSLLPVSDKGNVVAKDIFYDPVSHGFYRNVLRPNADTYQKIDLETGDTSIYCRFTCDGKSVILRNLVYANGVYYGISNYSKLYSFPAFTEGTIELTLLADYDTTNSAQNVQPLCYDKEENVLWWMRTTTRPIAYTLTKIDLKSYELTACGVFKNSPLEIYIPDYDEASDPGPHWYDPVDEIRELKLSSTSVSLMVGEEAQLSASYKPWNCSNPSVTWTSSDETVASVRDGKVTAVSAGTASVTAASVLNPEMTVTVPVTVSSAAIDIFGAMTDAEGSVRLLRWNFGDEKGPVIGEKIAVDRLTSAARGKDGTLWLSDGSRFYQVNGETGEVNSQSPESSQSYTDVTASTQFGGMFALSGTKLFYIDPATNVPFSSVELTAYASFYGADRFIAVASAGYYEYEDEDNEEYYDGEQLYLMDNNGKIYIVYFWKQNGELKGSINQPVEVTGLDLRAHSYQGFDYCSMVFNAGTRSLTLAAYTGGMSHVILLRPKGSGWSAYDAGQIETYPMALFSAGFNAAAPAEAEPPVVALGTLTAETAVRHEVDKEDGTVTVSLLAPVATANGVIDLEYDRTALQLLSAEGTAQLFSQHGDRLVFASRDEAPAGTELIRLTFRYADVSEAKLTVHLTQLTEEKHSQDEAISIVLPHTESNCPSRNFSDVKNDWSHEGIDDAIARGLMVGVGGNRFAPDGTMTRAMLAAVLYRMAGRPSAKADAPFTDVPRAAWYAESVAWAAENGIVSGTGKGLFEPGEPVTREQIVAMLRRYAAFCGRNVDEQADLSKFADANQISGWAKADVAWAVAEGLIEGRGGGILAPQGDATRAEVARILMNFNK